MRVLNNQSGRSMIEMLGVLVIIGVLSIGGISGYSKAMEKIKTNKTINLITAAYVNVKTLCKNQPCDEGEGPMPSLLYPEDLIGCRSSNYSGMETYNNCTTPLGVKFSMSNYDEQSYAFFDIYLSNLDNSACMTLSTYDWKFSDLRSISIGTNNDTGFFFEKGCSNVSYTKDSEDYVEGDSEIIFKCNNITPSEAAYICSQCKETGGCGLEFTFHY